MKGQKLIEPPKLGPCLVVTKYATEIVRPVLSHAFCIVFITRYYNVLCFDEYIGHILYFMCVTGYRMPAPQGTPDSIYELMKRCWDGNPQTRINFHELHSRLKDIVEKPARGENWS